ncbi:MAG: CHAT domain-containing protein [Okeania sp. SIO3B5]|nr:CHAT domain-containing protein [Okeania sp. SIO3B5]
MASKDLYHKGEIPLEAEELLQQFESLERQIDRLRFPKQSPNNRETIDAATATHQRAAWGATNEAIAKLEVEKQEVYRDIRKFDQVLAEGIQVTPLEFSKLQQLIEDDTTAILSFYSTNEHTHAFIVRRSGVDVHTCQGQGYRELQRWLRNNWLQSYAEISYLPGFIAAAQLLGCEVEAIEFWKLEETEVTVILKDGTSHTVDKTKFRELRQQEKERLDNEWNQQMPGKFAEISRWLQLDKLVEKLEGIQELILIPHLYLHQIPFAVLPLANNQYFGDKFLIRTQASCQVLDFCHQRPPLATNSPTYGIVENTTQDLYYSSYEGRQVAEMYQVADSQYLKGSEGTVNEYKKLLPQVQRLLSTHHAQSRLDNSLESALILADGRITLGQLLSPAFRFPDLDEVFLSCCETNLGSTDISDNMMTLNTGFLCAGARGAVSSLWSVDDLATSLFSVFYHQLRLAGKNRPQALQLAQQKLRQLTGKELEEKYGKELEKALREKLKEAYERFRETKKQRDSYPKDSPEYKQWQKEREKRGKIYDRIGRTIENLKQKSAEEHPFAHPIYWSGFICAGLRG